MNGPNQTLRQDSGRQTLRNRMIRETEAYICQQMICRDLMVPLGRKPKPGDPGRPQTALGVLFGNDKGCRIAPDIGAVFVPSDNIAPPQQATCQEMLKSLATQTTPGVPGM